MDGGVRARGAGKGEGGRGGALEMDEQGMVKEGGVEE